MSNKYQNKEYFGFRKSLNTFMAHFMLYLRNKNNILII